MSQVRDRVETAAGKSNMGNNISTLTTQVMDDAIYSAMFTLCVFLMSTRKSHGLQTHQGDMVVYLQENHVMQRKVTRINNILEDNQITTQKLF